MGVGDWMVENKEAIERLKIVGLREQEIWHKKYGKIRTPITARHNGLAIQAVKNQHMSGHWFTFCDFLMDYLKDKMGEQWGDEEIRKPTAKRNEIIKAYQAYCLWQQKSGMRDGVITNAFPSGNAQRFLSIAWDLFVLEDNSMIPQRMIERLRNQKNYQGARYELHVFASLIRAGFHLTYSDETDGHTRHTECTATYPETGEAISVEAKSRHRHGSLGFWDKRQRDSVGLGIGRLVKDARGKPAKHPYLLFLYINLGVMPIGDFYKSHRDEVCSILDKSELGNPDRQRPKIAGYILTNDPTHHVGDEQVPPECSFHLYVGPPEYRGPPSISVIQTIIGGLKQHAAIPHHLLYV